MGLLPPSTNADYRGARSAIVWVAVCALGTLGPGLVHSFIPDGGAGVIAGLDMGDKRDTVIGVFRWEGATQLAYGLVLALAAIRYQALTPFLLVTVIVERGLMALEGWVISPPANGHHPPEHYGSVAAVVLTLAFLALSLRRRKS